MRLIKALWGEISCQSSLRINQAILKKLGREKPNFLYSITKQIKTQYTDWEKKREKPWSNNRLAFSFITRLRSSFPTSNDFLFLLPTTENRHHYIYSQPIAPHSHCTREVLPENLAGGVRPLLASQREEQKHSVSEVSRWARNLKEFGERSEWSHALSLVTRPLSAHIWSGNKAMWFRWNLPSS